MHNCLILGSGRSGTSMVAGTLSKAGYFMGDNLYPARNTNPKGFFEDPEINGINEKILGDIHSQVLSSNQDLVEDQRWLMQIPVETKITSSSAINSLLQKVTEKIPFCFKDPRFSYTLPVWRPFLKDTVFICVFRDPAATAVSIIKECKDMDHFKNIIMYFSRAIEIWTCMYSHILEIHRFEGKWLFLHYNQVLTEEGLNKMESFTGAVVDRSFPTPTLQRSFSDRLFSEKTRQIYQQLCDIAGYKDVKNIIKTPTQLLEATARQIAEMDRQLAEQNRQIAEKDGQLAEQNRQIAEKDGQIQEIRNSYSWRITAPMRRMTKSLKKK